MYLLFDIGGTKTRLAVSHDLTSFDEPIIFDTDTHFSSGIIKLAENIKKITEGKKIKGVVGGMAGIFDKDRIKLLKSPNLPDWENKMITYELERIVEKNCDKFQIIDKTHKKTFSNKFLFKNITTPLTNNYKNIEKRINENKFNFSLE